MGGGGGGGPGKMQKRFKTFMLDRSSLHLTGNGGGGYPALVCTTNRLVILKVSDMRLSFQEF